MTKEELKQYLIEKFSNGYDVEQFNFVLAGMNFAENAHLNQKRKSGEDYIIHPYCVAEILFDLGFDQYTLVSALLHDVLEDTDITREEIISRFGTTVVSLVEGVTKLDKIKFETEEQEQTENLRKMFLAMSEDIRVVVIKLADRLHNMRTLEFLSPDRQKAISKETLDVYAPLAGRLGVSKIKSELEDLSMKYLLPKEYEDLNKSLPKQKELRQSVIKAVIGQITEKLNEFDIKAEVNGREKHLYSIYKKMKRLNKTLDEIYDVIAVRIIVDNIKDCYASLGIVHTMYKFLPDRFKDYISMPKINNYQSLHTTVMTSFGMPVEIQIRTTEMHKVAEYGIAAHWKYKEGLVSSNGALEDKVNWVREVLDAQIDSTEDETLLENVKIDIFDDEVFVFTPKGKAINLPAGSTCVDFAYHIHSKVGDNCIGANVNSKHVPLNTVLKTGDIVEIITSQNSKGPSRDWLNFVVSPQTKSKIRQFFKKTMREENVRIGKEMLEKEAVKYNVSLSCDEAKTFFNNYITKKNLTDINDVYARLGFGELTLKQIIPKIIALIRLKEKEQLKEENILSKSKNRRKAVGSVSIKGYDGLLVKIAGCCNPVPGDDIIAYLSRGRGAIVHRKDCPNLVSFEDERLIDASWVKSTNEEFIARFNIFVSNRKGIVADITTFLSLNKINIDSLQAKSLKDGDGLIELAVELTDTDTLDYLIKKISQIKGVYNIQRI